MDTTKNQTSESFNNNATDGFAKTIEGRLRAEDNPEFINQYKKLLSENDRVIQREDHDDMTGEEWTTTNKHMSLMKETGYEYLLFEDPPRFNVHIETLEKGEISFDECKDRIVEEAYAEIIEIHPEYDVGVDHLRKGLEKAYDTVLEAVENAQEHGIKVRGFDSILEAPDDTHEQDENAHIDSPTFRRDDAWDPQIESMTRGKNAVINTGGLHVGSSHGIDEYMEARGYKVGTFHIKNLEDGKHIDPSATVDDYTKMLLSDKDGYDPSDFAPDLFYDEQTKELITTAQEFGEAYVSPVLEQHGLSASDPFISQ